MSLPRRAGPPPRVRQGMPHEQLDQNAPEALQEELFRRASALPHVHVGRSLVSVPGARAFHLDPAHARGPPESRLVATEFAHLHPAHDGSLHMRLPEALAREAVAQGWGEPHPLARIHDDPTLVMVYGPRDAAELEVVWGLLRASHAWATGMAL